MQNHKDGSWQYTATVNLKHPLSCLRRHKCQIRGSELLSCSYTLYEGGREATYDEEHNHHVGN